MLTPVLLVAQTPKMSLQRVNLDYPVPVLKHLRMDLSAVSPQLMCRRKAAVGNPAGTLRKGASPVMVLSTKPMMSQQQLLLPV